MAIPSLAMKPSGYKGATSPAKGTLYSVLPTDGVGDFTVSRPTADALNTGNATRVNSAGLIETMGDNVPRLDYSDGGCPVLLTEPQSTNLITYSEDFSVGTYTKGNGATVTSNSTISPDGNLTASLVDLTTTNAYISYPVTFNAVEQTYSLYLKSATVDGTYTINWFDGTHHRELVNLTTSWQRFDIVFTPTANSGFVYLGDSRDLSPTLDTVYAWGAQLEELPYATSYIKTEGSVITRVADVVSGAGDATTFNSNAGVLFVEAKNFENSGSRYISVNDGSGSNTLQLRFSNGNFLFRVINGGVGVGNAISYATDLTINHKIACRWDNTAQTFTMFVDGSEVGIKQTGVTTSAVLSNFSLDSGSGVEFYGKTKALQVFNTALTDAELATLTTL